MNDESRLRMSQAHPGAGIAAANVAPGMRPGLEPDVTDLDMLDLGECEIARAGRRTMREKGAAGLRGLKHAFRGDSSFFAHAYRFLLIAITAAFFGVGPVGWVFLVLAATLVFLAEFTHSAIDTLARAVGDPDEPRLLVAREIATAGVLIAVAIFGLVTTLVLVLRIVEIFDA